LLIHGGRDHARNWDRVADAFLDRFSVYAPDLRGHGDSDWSIGGQYSMPEFVLDIEALADEIDRDPITIIGHSMGGGIALQYAGICSNRVGKIVSIEGLGPRLMMQRSPAHFRMRKWVADLRQLEERTPRRYASIDAAVARMEQENQHLSPEMARHLTIHGAKQNEDGTYSWKFDNYVRAHSPYQFNTEDAREIWNQIRSPVLLIRGTGSWQSDHEEDGRASAFHNYRSVIIDDAGHWVHHDQFERFVEVTREFLLE